MGLLPDNKRKPPMDTPRTFFIWGATMSGKSYLAEHFPNPFFINTDDNAEKSGMPNYQLKNVRDEKGNLKTSVISELDELILELGTKNHGFQTVVLDVIDDVIDLIEQAILFDNKIDTLSDMPFGKGFALQKQIVRGLVLELKQLDMNVVFVSRISEHINGNGGTDEMPSLNTKWYNLINGNCDLVIRTRRVGKTYTRMLTDRREEYKRDQIADPKILHILDNIPGMFPRATTTTDKK